MTEIIPEVVAEVEPAVPAEAPLDQAAPESFAGPSLRPRVLDALEDADEPLTVARLLQELPGVSRNTLEGALRRALAAHEIERTSPGTYRLVPPGSKPAGPAPPPEPDADAAQKAEAARQATLAKDAARKRLARERDRDAAIARQVEADRQLLAKLVEAAGGNVAPGPELDDVSPIRCALQLGVELHTVLDAIGSEHSLLACPRNPRAKDWRSDGLLKRIATSHMKGLAARLIAAMSAAKPAQKAVHASDALAAGPGPPEQESELAMDGERSAGDPGDDGGESVELEVDSEQLDLQSILGQGGGAPVVAHNRGHISGPDLADEAISPDPPEAFADAEPDMENDIPHAIAGRADVLRAFLRNGPAPESQPAPAPKPVAKPAAEKPWFSGPRQQPRETDLTDDAVDELVQGWKAGNLSWPRRLLGEHPPGHPQCRLSRETLRRNGL